MTSKVRPMSFIYAMSDIHGITDAFKEALSLVDLRDKNNKLVLLGDYIGRKGDQTEILLFIKSLEEHYGEQVVVLMGNHELYLLDSKEMADDWKEWAAQGYFDDVGPSPESSDFVSLKDSEENVIIAWLSTLPFYYETERQIYVHAGIDEDAGAYWNFASENHYFCQKHPPTIGAFTKDVIAGHVSAYKMFEWYSQIPYAHYDNGIFWDGKSHFFIDGDVEVTSTIPVLKYNTDSGVYSSFKKTKPNGSRFHWAEYIIKP